MAEAGGWVKDVRCIVHDGARIEDGKLQVNFALKKRQQGDPHKFHCTFESLEAATPEQWLDFEAQQVVPWIASHEKFSGRDSATCGAFLRHNPNGFVCLHGTEDEMLQLIQQQEAVPADGIHMLLPVAVASLSGSHSSLRAAEAAVNALKPLIAKQAQTLGTDSDSTGQRAPPGHFLEALLADSSRIKPHGVLLASLAAAASSGALPPRSTHVLLGVSKKPRGMHCELECFGGKRHLGETTQASALREFEEESGIPRARIVLQCEQPLLVGRHQPLNALFMARPAESSAGEPAEQDAAVRRAVQAVAALPQFEFSTNRGRGKKGRGRRGRGGRGQGSGRRRDAPGGAAADSSWEALRGLAEGMPEDR